MPYVSVWPAALLQPALDLAMATDLRPTLALAVSELPAVPDRLVAALRARRAEVATRGLFPLPLTAPEEAWRMNLSLGQQAFWEALGRMPAAAFGIPFPSLLLEAHLDVALLEGSASALYLLKDRVVVPCLDLAPAPPAEVPAERRSVVGFLGPVDASFVTQHGSGLLPSELACLQPRATRPAPVPAGGALPSPRPESRTGWEALLRSF